METLPKIEKKKGLDLGFEKLQLSAKDLLKKLQSKSLKELVVSPGKRSLNLLLVSATSMLLALSSCEEPPEHGAYNYSDENIQIQRDWLVNWISNRDSLELQNFSEEDLQKLKDKLIFNIKNVEMRHIVGGKGRGGAYFLNPFSNSPGFVQLNETENQNPLFKNAPEHEALHSGYHVSQFGGTGNIPEAYIKIITESARKNEEIMQFIKGDPAGKALWAQYQKEFPDGGKSPEQIGDYASYPTEFLSFLMDLRHELNLTPKQKVDDEMIKNIFQKCENGEFKTIGSQFFIMIIKKESLKKVLNEFVLNKENNNGASEIA